MAGKCNKKTVDLVSVFEGVGERARGRISEKEMKELEDNACPGAGSCSGMFTANSMNCLSEALGLALPGNGTRLAISAERKRLAELSGIKVMELVRKKVKPRDIATRKAFENAIQIAEEEKLDTSISLEYNKLVSALERYKTSAVNRNKEKLSALIRDEIIKRYFYSEGLYEYYKANNPEIKKAIYILSDPSEYNKVLK